MPEFDLEQVIAFLKKAEMLERHYKSILRTPEDKLPSNADMAVRELIRGHFDEKWEPLLAALISIEDPGLGVDVVEVGLTKEYEEEDAHIGGSVRLLIDSKKEELQTGMQILCRRPDGSQVIVQVYSDTVPLFRYNGEEKYFNTRASEPSRVLRLLQYVREHELSTLGWISWPRPEKGK